MMLLVRTVFCSHFSQASDERPCDLMIHSCRQWCFALSYTPVQLASVRILCCQAKVDEASAPSGDIERVGSPW